MDGVKVARQEIEAVAGELTALRDRLLGVKESIPPSALEISQEDLEGEPDAATELRSVIGIGIQDYLEPLIRDLLSAADGRED